MQSLPVETWTRIIQKADQRDKFSLSLTCSFLRPIAQAALFETIVFVLSDSFQKDVFPKFVLAFTDRPDLASYVHTLRVVRHNGGFIWNREPFLRPHRDFPLFPNLQRLYIRAFVLDNNLLIDICSHPCLSFVRFDHCFLDPQLDCRPRAMARNDTLKDIEIGFENVGLVGCWVALISASPRYLEIYFPFRDEMAQEEMNAIMSEYKLHSVTSTLTSVRIVIGRIPTKLISLLISSPQIQHLSLDFLTERLGHEVALSLKSLPQDALPFLENFTGSAAVAGTLVPGRPVHTVTLLRPFWVAHNAILALQYSTISVTVLGIPLYRDPLSVHLPTSIRRLWLESNFTFDSLTEFIPGLSRLKDLRVLVADFFHVQDSERGLIRLEPIIQRVSAACPSIQEFHFIQEFNFYEERWVLRNDGGWERYIPM